MALTGLSESHVQHQLTTLEKEAHGSTRVLRITGCLLVAAFAQTTLKNVSAWLGYIDWLLLVTVYIGLLRLPRQALLTGAVAGFLQDNFSGAPLGVSGIAKVLVAYLASWVSAKVFVEGLPVRIATVVGATMLDLLTHFSFYRMLNYSISPLAGTYSPARAILFGMIINLSVAIPFFALLDWVFQIGAQQRLRRAEAMRGMRRRR